MSDVIESPGDRAERLVGVALQLAVVVHDEERDSVARHLAAIDSADREALLVIMAGLIDVSRPVGDLLGWVTWDENGKPLPPAPKRTLTAAPRARKPRRKLDVPARIRRAHAAFNRGERSPQIVEDERTYQRERGRRRYAEMRDRVGAA